MSLHKKVLLGVGIALVLGVLGLFLPTSKTIVDSTKVDVAAIAQAVYDQVKSESSVGAASGPDSFFDCETHNGIKQCFTRVGLMASSSVACIVKAPSATSTLVRFNVRINSNGLGAQNFDVSTTTAALGVAGSTSTPAFIASAAIGASAQGDYFWQGGYSSSTQAKIININSFTTMTGASSYLIRSGEVITAKIATTSTAGSGIFATYLGGFCEATFELN